MRGFRWNILKVVILSALFGFASGILGGLVIAGLYAPVYGLHEQINNASPVRTGILKEAERANKMQSALISFYINRQNSYLSADDRVGFGIMLTTDGWIATSEQVLRSGASRLIAVSSDRTVYPLEKVVVDSATRAAFVKIKGEKMPTLGTAGARDILGDAILLTTDTNKKIFKARYIGITYTEGEENYLQSSEILGKYLFVSQLDLGLQPGGPLINNNGEVVGIIVDAVAGKAIPFDYVYPAFRELLKTGRVSRPYIGLNYFDLSSLLYLRKGIARGAEISGISGKRGVLRGGPAANAGLVEGDIILKVNDDELSYKTSFSEAISQYQIGSNITLLIRHADGKEESKEVVLAGKP